MTYRISRARPARFVLSLALSGAAAAACAGLWGCTSALSNNDTLGSAQNTVLIIAKAIAQGNYRGDAATFPTIPGALQELPPEPMARVDSPGPAPVVTLDNGPDALSQDAAQERRLLAQETGGTPVGGTAVVPVDAAATQPAIPSTPGTVVPVAPAGSPTPEQPNGANVATPGPVTTEPLGAANAQTDSVGLAAAALNEPETQFNLSLQDAIARAMRNSLDVRVDSYNPGIKEDQIIEAEAAFDPVVFAQSQWSNIDEPLIESGFVLNGQNWDNQIGIKRLLPTGATVQAAFDSTYRDIYNGFGSIAPALKTSYTTSVNLQVTQPLFRGFGADVNLANIYLAQRDRRIALETFRRTVITEVANVEEAYHNLVLAKASVEIQQRLLAASESTYARVDARKNIDADAIAVSQSIAAVEQRRAELIAAFAQLRSQSDRLKNLLNDPQLNLQDNVLINPTDRPTAEPIAFSAADAIATALEHRTEIQEARLQIEKADIVVRVAKNDMLPKVDFTGSVQTTGLDKAFDRAFSSEFNPFGQFLDFRAGVQVQFALGDRQGEAEFNRRKIERQQAITQLVRVAQTVVLDVKLQLRDMLSSYQQILMRERARVAAARELQAITQKELIVALTPEFLQLKLDAQSQLAQAEQNLVQAMVNYNLAIMRLEQAKGTLLEFDRISLDRAPITRQGEDLGKLRFMGQTYTLDGNNKK